MSKDKNCIHENLIEEYKTVTNKTHNNYKRDGYLEYDTYLVFEKRCKNCSYKFAQQQIKLNLKEIYSKS